ncbi:hypothetical protein [Variovorax saccharolyticus]|uniref:hypothetical protein n=1 Tax=Variovorax saccharolyticus TaxID=3053516 RepID=UPI0025762EE8|nr:hypothetical protein [Variovorax sp. J22R187]MDM0018182.1 hypothetical protein [Variovorax sp. J22R187]
MWLYAWEKTGHAAINARKSMLYFWTPQDYLDKLCTADQVGLARDPAVLPTVNADGSALTAREYARSVSHHAVQALLDVLRTGSPDARIKAAQALLDRGWGRVPEEEQRESRRPPSGERATFTAAQVEQIATVMAIGMVEKAAEEGTTFDNSFLSKVKTEPELAPIPTPPPAPEPLPNWFERNLGKRPVKAPAPPVVAAEPKSQAVFWDGIDRPAEGDIGKVNPKNWH